MKIVLDGETYEYDNSHQPMSEALAIEQVYKRRYVEWQQDLGAGSAKALCVLAWVIWRRDGRDISFEDIIAGKVDFDMTEMLVSLGDTGDEGAAPDPTIPATPPDPAGTRGTRKSTKASSAST